MLFTSLFVFSINCSSQKKKGNSSTRYLKKSILKKWDRIVFFPDKKKQNTRDNRGILMMVMMMRGDCVISLIIIKSQLTATVCRENMAKITTQIVVDGLKRIDSNT
jgi:hypothetical protein